MDAFRLAPNGHMPRRHDHAHSYPRIPVTTSERCESLPTVNCWNRIVASRWKVSVAYLESALISLTGKSKFISGGHDD